MNKLVALHMYILAQTEPSLDRVGPLTTPKRRCAHTVATAAKYTVACVRR